jgi:hypothetical protein
MTTRFPKGKSARTKTAQMVEAFASDIEMAAKGLRAAAQYYKNGNIEAGERYVNCSMDSLRMPMNIWRQRK